MVYSSVSDADDFFIGLKKILDGAKNKDDLFYKIVNAPFSDLRHTTTLGLGVLTLCLENKKAGTIDRISMSDTDMANGARDITVKPFNDLIVPMDYKGNIVVEAIRSGHYQQTSDWHYLLTPVLKAEESRMNQAGAAIATSFVYPLINTRPRGGIIFHYFVTMDKISNDHHNFMFRYIKLVSQALNKY